LLEPADSELPVYVGTGFFKSNAHARPGTGQIKLQRKEERKEEKGRGKKRKGEGEKERISPKSAKGNSSASLLSPR